MLKLTRRTRGFTLIEMAVTATIASVLAAAAIPSFSHTMGRQRLTLTTNELNATFSLARSEALARGERVAVAPRVAGRWDSGWQVFVDRNDDGALDATDIVLREFAPTAEGIGIEAIGGGFPQVVSYTSTGLARRAGSDGLALGRFVVRYQGADPRAICFSSARTRINPGATCS